MRNAVYVKLVKCRGCRGTPAPGKTQCEPCRLKWNAQRAQERADRRAIGLCTECGNEPADGAYLGLGPHCSDRHARSIVKQREARRVRVSV